MNFIVQREWITLTTRESNTFELLSQHIESNETCILKHQSPFQVRTPLTAQTLPHLPQLPQPGLAGAYSVELVSWILVSPPNSNLTQRLGNLCLVTTVVAVCWPSVLASLQIYPHRFPGTGGVNPAQVARRSAALRSACEKCQTLIFFSFHAAALPHSWLHQVLHPPATRQTECGSGEFAGTDNMLTLHLWHHN